MGELEDFNEDLYLRFKWYLKENEQEAVEIYRQMLIFIDKKRDEELSEPWDMTDDISPQEYQKMHEQRRQ